MCLIGGLFSRCSGMFDGRSRRMQGDVTGFTTIKSQSFDTEDGWVTARNNEVTA